jgi:hypothetical protein
MIRFLIVPVLIALLIVPNSAAFACSMGASSFAPGHHFAHFHLLQHRHHFALFATAIGLG